MCFLPFYNWTPLCKHMYVNLYQYAASPSHQVSRSLGDIQNRESNLQRGHCAPPHYFRKVPWVGNLKDPCFLGKEAKSQRVHVFGDFVSIKVNEMGRMWDTCCSICVWPIYDLLCEEGGEFPGTELHLKIAFVRIQSWFHLSISFFQWGLQTNYQDT